MKKFFLILPFIFMGSALAQDAAAPAPATGLPELPAANAPASPALPQAQSRRGYFPALPPSRPCTRKDIIGEWVLNQIFEDPAGGEIAAYQAQRFQVIRFDNNTLYTEYRSAKQPTEKQVVRGLQPRENLMQQFVVDNDSGMVFFYRNGVSTGGLACFIVVNAKDSFKAGHLLLMLPMNADGTPPAVRIVKAYQKVPPPKKPRRRRR